MSLPRQTRERGHLPRGRGSGWLSPASLGVLTITIIVVGVYAAQGSLGLGETASEPEGEPTPLPRLAAPPDPGSGNLVLASALAVASPTAQPSPTATATPTQEPTAEVAEAQAEATPEPPTSTPLPEPTATPEPPTPEPPTATPVLPTATPIPPTPTPEPTATATPASRLRVNRINDEGPFNGMATPYSDELEGRTLGCLGAGEYDRDDETIIAVAPPQYDDIPCGMELEVCGPEGCISGSRQDSCPGCGDMHVDLSRAGFNEVCGRGANSCTVVITLDP
jgi:hypothetical protein